jgi:hypothetical protein
LVVVYNLMGQRVYEGRYTETVNLSNLNNGIYIVRLIDRLNNTSISEKLWISQ